MLSDLRLAVRLLRRSPLSTAIALLSISLSVGATAVVFAAIKSVLIEPLPFARPSEIVQLRSEFPRMQQQSAGDWVVANDIRELPGLTSTLGPLGAYHNSVFDLAGDGSTTPEALYGLLVNADVFPILGVSPILGRTFLPEEHQTGHADTMILSYGLWVRRFHSDPAIAGRTVTVNGHAVLVAGVMPPGFNFPLRREAAHTPSPYVEFWAAPLHLPANPAAGLGAIARLRPGVTLDQARQDISSAAATLAHDFPATNRDRVLRLNWLRDRTVGAAGKRLWLLFGAAVFFMLIGCANVANLLLARGLARRQEMAVRMAIGAAPWRIVRQLLTESCLLAILGGVAGYLLTAGAWKLLPAIAPVSIPRLAAARADRSVFTFALALSIVNGILFGLAPALRMSGWKLAVRGAASGRHDRVRSCLVTAEVAISVMLVVLCGQVLAGFVSLLGTNPGFQADRVVASVVLPSPDRYRDPDRRALFYQRLVDAVRAIPGVQSAGAVDALPFSGENHGGTVSGGAAQPLTAEIDVTGGDYLQSMGVRLVEGRWFRDEEMSPSNDSAIVNEFLERRLWPASSALGQRICVDCTPENPTNWKRVVGVVSSASHAALDEPEKGNVYLAAGAMRKSVFLVARTKRPTGEIEPSIRRAIAAIDPNQPVFLSASMRDLIADSIADRRFIMLLLSVMASLALLLSAAGIYGVVAYTTSRRTQEIGIRMALGATPRDVLGLIFRQGFLTVATGLAIGLVAAYLVSPLIAGMASFRFVYVALATTLVAVAAGIACWVPARRATKIDPVSALR